MPTILADRNVEGHLEELRRTANSRGWSDIWKAIEIDWKSFGDVELALNAPDEQVWRFCQRERFILVTANRTSKGKDSLETTIRRENSKSSLPVLTIADADRVMIDGDYAELVLVRMLEYLMDVDCVLGTGRLYLP